MFNDVVADPESYLLQREVGVRPSAFEKVLEHVHLTCAKLIV